MDSSKGIKIGTKKCRGAAGADFRHPQPETLDLRINFQIVGGFKPHETYHSSQTRVEQEVSNPPNTQHVLANPAKPPLPHWFPSPPSARPPHLVELGALRSWVSASAALPAHGSWLRSPESTLILGGW